MTQKTRILDLTNVPEHQRPLTPHFSPTTNPWVARLTEEWLSAAETGATEVSDHGWAEIIVTAAKGNVAAAGYAVEFQRRIAGWEGMYSITKA